MSYMIIGSESCAWCEKAINLLESKKLSWEGKTLDENKWLIPLMIKAGYSTIPLIFDPDNKVIGGYTELEALLKDKESKT